MRHVTKTTSHRVICLAASLVFVASVQSCGSEAPTGVERELPATLTTVLLDASDSQGYHVRSRALPLSFAMIGPWSFAGCSYDSTTSSYLCPTTVVRGLTMEHSFALFDAAGNRQAEFSPTTTASVQIKSHVASTIASSLSSLTIDNVDDRTVSGLLTSRRVLNGTSTLTTSSPSSLNKATLDSLKSRSVSRIENLVLPSASNPWPGPGTITTDQVITFAGIDASSRIRGEFYGTSCVAISIDYGSFTDSFTVDLSNLSAPSCSIGASK